MPTIALTLGDTAGIGPEIVRAALDSGRMDAGFDYEVIGEIPPGTQPGVPTEATARAAAVALEEAARRALAGEVAAVVTAPVSKAALYATGFAFPGQTEFFAARCGVENFAMCLTGGGLTVALASIHVPLRVAVETLRASEIVRVGRLLADFLLAWKGRARIAVAGLNPHAGEGGALGDEDARIILPAVEELRAGGVGEFAGPFPPDTVFHAARAGTWDAVLCMYHDQGLIPLKTVAFDEGVNVTLGLPIIRTSPDHGTAFDIAGRGLARPDSFLAAARLAAELARGR